jgi:stage III sporulation protein AG
MSGSLDENGDNVHKPRKKVHTALLGLLFVLFIIFIYSNVSGIGGGKERVDGERTEYDALEQALMKIDGIGEVTIYSHYEKNDSTNTLSDYFSMSTTKNTKENELRGILVIAEGAGDLLIQSKLKKILSAVLQLPEHRIVVVEMKSKGEND